MATALQIVRKFFPQVSTVIDATENVFIEVTESDAASKAVKDHEECAMAVACKRSLKLDGVIISRDRAYLVKGNKAKRYVMLETGSREVTAFDRGGVFAPGLYGLRRPGRNQRLGRDDGSHTDTGTGQKKSKPRHYTSGIRAVLGSKDN